MTGPIAILDPEPYLRAYNDADRFVRRLPDPDAPRCGTAIADEPAAEIVDRWSHADAAQIVGMTTCLLAPGHARPVWDDNRGCMATVHEGLLVVKDQPVDSLSGYRWLNPRALGQLQ